MEEQAETFYRRFAKEAKNPGVRELCRQLADEEAQHSALIRDVLSRWKSRPITQDDLDAMDADGRLRGMFASTPDPDADEKELVEYAMDQESQMVAKIPLCSGMVKSRRLSNQSIGSSVSW